MITVNEAESALKNIYLESIVNDLNTKTNPFLTMIQKNTKTIATKDAIVPIRYNNQNSVRAGAEDGPLPTNSDARTAEVIVPLKNLFGSFQITDKALKAAQNSPGAFAALIGGEMNNLVATAQANLNRMIYGNGFTPLGFTTAVHIQSRVFTVPSRFASNFSVGTVFQAWSTNNSRVHSGMLTVSAITTIGANTMITHTGAALTDARSERFYLYAETLDEHNMNGIDSIFRPEKLYNLRRNDHSAILPFQQTNNLGDLLPLTEDNVLDFFTNFEERVEGRPTNIIMCHTHVEKALFNNLRANRTNIDMAEMAGGFRAATFNGIPVYSDVRARGGCLFALNSDSFAMHQLCDWSWLEGEDGSILKPVSGQPLYSATLVKYADLICERPFLQGKLNGFAARWR